MDVVTVVVDGNIVVRDRRLVTADVDKILQVAKAVAHALVDLSRGGAVQHYAP